MTESDLSKPVRQTSSGDDLALLDGWWRACNYLSVGMIYLIDNPCSGNL